MITLNKLKKKDFELDGKIYLVFFLKVCSLELARDNCGSFNHTYNKNYFKPGIIVCK